MLNIKFSILSYHYSFLSNDSITLGILFHCKDNNRTEFIHTSKWSRIESFDDEVNINILKLTLQGIKDETSFSLLHNQTEFDIKEYTKYFINELKFSKINEASAENFDDFVELTKKIHLRFDYPKGKRASENDFIFYMDSIFKAKNIIYNKKSLKGKYNETIQYDYLIDSKNTGIKLFNISDSNISFQFNQAKVWKVNSEEGSPINTIFAYNLKVSQENLDRANQLLRLLKDTGRPVEKVENIISLIA